MSKITLLCIIMSLSACTTLPRDTDTNPDIYDKLVDRKILQQTTDTQRIDYTYRAPTTNDQECPKDSTAYKCLDTVDKVMPFVLFTVWYLLIR